MQGFGERGGGKRRVLFTTLNLKGRRRRRIYLYSMILQRDPGRLRLSQGASFKS